MMQTAIAVMGVLVCAAILALLLRGQRPELSLCLSLAAGAAVLLMLMQHMAPLLSSLHGMLEDSAIPSEYIKAVLKATGICLLTQLTADTCRDAGETALAGKAELAGRILLLLLSLPLFEDMLKLVTVLAQGQAVSG